MSSKKDAQAPEPQVESTAGFPPGFINDGGTAPPGGFRSMEGPADTDGTYDVPQAAAAAEAAQIPPELFRMPAREVAKAFLKALQTAPNLRAQGDPRRTMKNQSRYLKAVVQHLAQALERI